ncbi:MAG: GNAT family N-acetyltransferase [Hyphomonadaceae bacterium]
MNVFSDNTERHRYELTAPEGISWADYRDIGGVRAILHVETPAEARGLGYAQKLMDAIVGKARADNTKLRPSCSYAVAYFRRHPAAADILA